MTANTLIKPTPVPKDRPTPQPSSTVGIPSPPLDDFSTSTAYPTPTPQATPTFIQPATSTQTPQPTLPPTPQTTSLHTTSTIRASSRSEHFIASTYPSPPSVTQHTETPQLKDTPELVAVLPDASPVQSDSLTSSHSPSSKTPEATLNIPTASPSHPDQQPSVPPAPTLLTETLQTLVEAIGSILGFVVIAGPLAVAGYLVRLRRRIANNMQLVVQAVAEDMERGHEMEDVLFERAMGNGGGEMEETDVDADDELEDTPALNQQDRQQVRAAMAVQEPEVS